MNSENTKKNESGQEQNEERKTPKFNLGDILEFDAESNLGADVFAKRIQVKALEYEGLSIYYLVENTDNSVQAWYPLFLIEQIYKKVN